MSRCVYAGPEHYDSRRTFRRVRTGISEVEIERHEHTLFPAARVHDLIVGGTAKSLTDCCFDIAAAATCRVSGAAREILVELES